MKGFFLDKDKKLLWINDPNEEELNLKTMRPSAEIFLFFRDTFEKVIIYKYKGTSLSF